MKISEEDLWSLELAKFFDEGNLDKMRVQFHELLDLLVYLHEVLAEKNVLFTENEVMSEQLILKFYFHGLTICKISEGYKLTSKYYTNTNLSKAIFIDISSLLTVGRAQLETLLMYQHLYINDQNPNEQKLRYYCWIYTALLQRRETPATEQEVKIQLEKDVKEIARLKSEIEKLDSFKKLSPNQQKGLFKTGTAKLFKTWQTIFDESGFPKEKLFSRLYYIFSAYSHSEGLSAIQMKSSKQLLSNKTNHEMVHLQLFCSTLMAAIMIRNIVSKHEAVANRFKAIEKKTQFKVNFFSKLGRV